MAEASQLHDTSAFHSFLLDETFDYTGYDEDDTSPDTENIDVMDEDKIELVDIAERETDFSNDSYLQSINNCLPLRFQNSMPSVNYSNAQINIPSQQYNIPNMTWFHNRQMSFQQTQSPCCDMIGNSINLPGSMHFSPSMNECNTSYPPLDPMLRGLINNPAFPNMNKDKYDSIAQEKLNKQNHIKKPLNAFMLYMRDVRPEVLKEIPHKDSTTINQMIGKMWQALNKEGQSCYFERAREERERHKIMYPEYNPRDYYAQSLKKKRRKRDKQINEPLPKKCRARYGINQQDQWCKHCKRKKKCLKYAEGLADPDVKVNEETTIEKTPYEPWTTNSNTQLPFTPQ